jgi:hypothetical protein
MKAFCPPPAPRKTIASPCLAETAKNYARADNTRRAYDAGWRHFSSLLLRQGLPQLPPDPQTVRALSRRLRRRRWTGSGANERRPRWSGASPGFVGITGNLAIPSTPAIGLRETRRVAK